MIKHGVVYIIKLLCIGVELDEHACMLGYDLLLWNFLEKQFTFNPKLSLKGQNNL